jgi:potassium-transporting ATPase potassium-binding subunit
MSESLAGALFVASLALALVVVHRPLGDLLYWVANSPRDLAPERWAYRLVGADPKSEQSWSVDWSPGAVSVEEEAGCGRR